MKKTNAMRILDKAGIPYKAEEYDDDGEHELEHGAASRTAEKLGVNPDQVFKTIVFKSESKEVLVFCQSAVHEINEKKARNAAGVKSVTPVKQDELLALTGYIRGGCSPIGMKKQYRTFIDSSVMNLNEVCVSAGARGVQLKLAPADLVKASNAEVCDLVL
ncbi:Cys-tRNA(Pro) deacylase [Treponema sp.]|uniref:Cys-tRNA(Pro) deacylase n=1 Tax=Treponema sp. TaxID=166 RepID=UPI003890A8E5